MADASQAVRLQLVITGRVQGVGFRYAVLDEARRLQVAGWVRNRRDGSVEVIAEGSRGRLEQLAVWCHDGPRGALVSHVETNWGEASGEFHEFSIRH
ncbi:MAG: acylphosphatase [Deltaproteobacteria bacterium]|nr:acylphosphatase [Deltaproteobacteria bacterium]MBI3388996.1 acylphosphatase [Deltaproteobacteria bacterium]